MNGLPLELLLAVALASEPSQGHRAPVESLAQAPGASAQRHNTLAEMWQRRILSPESRNWTAEDMELLSRVRAAEDMGAIPLLRQRIKGSLGLLVISYRPAGSKAAVLRMTREGYERWQFFRAQDAIAYFERKGVETGLAFRLEDMDGRRLFDAAGLLTAAGEAVFSRALANSAVWWRLPSAEVFGTRPPPAPAPPLASAALSMTPGPEHASIADQVYRLSWGMHYQPVMLSRRLGRLNIIEEHDPRHSGPPSYLVVVHSDADKASARKELRRRLAFLGPFDGDAVLSKAEKLAKMGESLRQMGALSGRKASWTIDAAAVGRQIDKDLQGSLAVVYVLLGPVPPEPPPERRLGPEPAPQAPDAPSTAVDGVATEPPKGQPPQTPPHEHEHEVEQP